MLMNLFVNTRREREKQHRFVLLRLPFNIKTLKATEKKIFQSSIILLTI